MSSSSPSSSSSSQPYPPFEASAAKEGSRLLITAWANPSLKKHETPYSRVEMSYSHDPKDPTKFQTLSSCVVHASFFATAAFFYDLRSRFFQAGAPTPAAKILEVKTPRHLVSLTELSIGPSKQPDWSRLFVSDFLWKLGDDKQSMMLVSLPVAREVAFAAAAVQNSTAVIGEATKVFRLSKLTDASCKVSYLSIGSLGGTLPRADAKAYFLGEALETLRRAQLYFLQSISLDDFSAEHGECLAVALMDEVDRNVNGGSRRDKASIKDATTAAFWGETKFFGELNLALPWFKTFLVRVVRNKLIMKGNIPDSSPSDLDHAQAIEMGEAFAMTLLSNTDPGVAVAELIGRYPLLAKVDADYAWFRPLLNQVAKRLLSASKLGAKLRAYSGALLSSMDLVTDLNMIKVFLKTGKDTFAHASIAMVCTSLLFQILLVCFQNHKKPWMVLIAEVGLCFLCLKPGLDAYRASSGEPADPDKPMDAPMEMIVGKIIEMVTESIPGFLVQAYALLLLVKTDNPVGVGVALGSIFFSCLSTAYSSTVVAYDWDTNTTKRRLVPEFYGFFPDSPTGRTLMFLSIFLFTAALLMLKTFTITLLFAVDSRLTAGYFLIDYGLYFLVKLSMRDFIYWVRVDNFPVSVCLSVLLRFIMKVATDFSGLLQGR